MHGVFLLAMWSGGCPVPCWSLLTFPDSCPLSMGTRQPVPEQARTHLRPHGHPRSPHISFHLTLATSVSLCEIRPLCRKQDPNPQRRSPLRGADPLRLGKPLPTSARTYHQLASESFVKRGQENTPASKVLFKNTTSDTSPSSSGFHGTCTFSWNGMYIFSWKLEPHQQSPISAETYFSDSAELAEHRDSFCRSPSWPRQPRAPGGPGVQRE